MNDPTTSDADPTRPADDLGLWWSASEGVVFHEDSDRGYISEEAVLTDALPDDAVRLVVAPAPAPADRADGLTREFGRILRGLPPSIAGLGRPLEEVVTQLVQSALSVAPQLSAPISPRKGLRPDQVSYALEVFADSVTILEAGVSTEEQLARTLGQAARAVSPSQSWRTVKGRCPNCGHVTLILSDGGRVVCSSADCDDPSMADDLLGFAHRRGNEVRIARATAAGDLASAYRRGFNARTLYGVPSPVPDEDIAVPADLAATGPAPDGPSFVVDQVWFRDLLEKAGITYCVPITLDDVVMQFADLEKRRVETQREADGIGRNLDQEMAKTRVYRLSMRGLAARLGVTVGPTDTPNQIEVLSEALLHALPPAGDEIAQAADALAARAGEWHGLPHAEQITALLDAARCQGRSEITLAQVPHLDLPNLRGRFYGAFSEGVLIRRGFGLLNVWRHPDAPELDRMAAAAAKVVAEVLGLPETPPLEEGDRR